MSDTPRTDKETGKSIGSDSIVYASFARQLERELAKMTAYADKLAGAGMAMLENDGCNGATFDAHKLRVAREKMKTALAAAKGGSHDH
jgi:hypothetical protein